MNTLRFRCARSVAALAASIAGPLSAQAQERPNIAIIWGDDVGAPISRAYTDGVMGDRLPISIASPART